MVGAELHLEAIGRSTLGARHDSGVLSAAYSPEFQGAEWVEPDATLGVGSSFIGTNHNETFGEFKVPSFIDAWDEDVAFGWRTSDADNPGARWRFDVESTP